jgi:hypothetical protein
MHTGYTIVTRESPWDEHEAAAADALTEYEAQRPLCGHAEGEQDWVPDQRVCPTCRDLAFQSRVWERDEKHLPKPAPGEPHPLDGVTKFLRPPTPDEVLAARRKP